MCQIHQDLMSNWILGPPIQSTTRVLVNISDLCEPFNIGFWCTMIRCCIKSMHLCCYLLPFARFFLKPLSSPFNHLHEYVNASFMTKLCAWKFCVHVCCGGVKILWFCLHGAIYIILFLIWSGYIGAMDIWLGSLNQSLWTLHTFNLKICKWPYTFGLNFHYMSFES